MNSKEKIGLTLTSIFLLILSSCRRDVDLPSEHELQYIPVNIDGDGIIYLAEAANLPRHIVAEMLCTRSFEIQTDEGNIASVETITFYKNNPNLKPGESKTVLGRAETTAFNGEETSTSFHLNGIDILAIDEERDNLRTITGEILEDCRDENSIEA